MKKKRGKLPGYCSDLKKRAKVKKKIRRFYGPSKSGLIRMCPQDMNKIVHRLKLVGTHVAEKMRPVMKTVEDTNYTRDFIHTHTYMCVCTYVYVYIWIYIWIWIYRKYTGLSWVMILNIGYTLESSRIF